MCAAGLPQLLTEGLGRSSIDGHMVMVAWDHAPASPERANPSAINAYRAMASDRRGRDPKKRWGMAGPRGVRGAFKNMSQNGCGRAEGCGCGAGGGTIWSGVVMPAALEMPVNGRYNQVTGLSLKVGTLLEVGTG